MVKAEDDITQDIDNSVTELKEKVMEKSTTLLKAEKAFLNNEVKKFLMGYGEYNVPMPHFGPPIDIPTDFSSVVRNGIFALYEEDIMPKEKVIFEYEKALKELMHESRLGVWVVGNILFEHRYAEGHGHSPFKFPDYLIDAYTENAIDNQIELMMDRRYTGANNVRGLMDDIVRFHLNCKEEFGVGILNEEIWKTRKPK